MMALVAGCASAPLDYPKQASVAIAIGETSHTREAAEVNKWMEAADRGVRVRLLLDDVFTNVDDLDLAVLNDHPNIELRIFRTSVEA